MDNVTYKRINIRLELGAKLKDIYGEQVRIALTSDGLLDDPIAHGHLTDGKLQQGLPSVYFRRIADTVVEVVGIGDKAITYLEQNAYKLQRDPLHFITVDGRHITAPVESLAMQKNVDHIVIGGGFHAYTTKRPVYVSKHGRTNWERLMAAKSNPDEQRAMVAGCVARSVRGQFAALTGVKEEAVMLPRVFLDENVRFGIFRGKKNNPYLYFQGDFGMNAHYSGGSSGLGIGLAQTSGVGIISVLGGQYAE